MTIEKPELFQLLKTAEQAVKIADQILLENFGRLSTLEEKDRAGLVTNVDRESEEAMTKFFAKETPDILVVGEEAAYFDKDLINKNVKEPRWVVDPLDGTTNYVHSFPIFCVSLGLEVNQETILGVISVPKLGQTFTAVKGGGCFLNGEPIKVSERKQLKDCMVATGFSVSKPEMLQQQLEYFDAVISKSRGVRRAGAAAYDLAMVAMGVFDAYWEAHLQPWDTSAGSLLVSEAGGRVSQYDGSSYKSTDDGILVSNGHIHEVIVEALQSCHGR